MIYKGQDHLATAQEHLKGCDGIQMDRGRNRRKPLTPWLLASGFWETFQGETAGRHWGRYLKRTNRKKKRTQGTYKIPKPATTEPNSALGPLPSQRNKVVTVTFLQTWSFNVRN